jgi:hypothetical protein
VWQRVNLGSLVGILVNVLQAGQSIGTVNVHGTGSADSFTAGSTKGKSRILFIFNFDQDIQHHRSAVIEIDGISTQIRPLLLFGIPAIDLEILDPFGLGEGLFGSSFEGSFCGT